MDLHASPNVNLLKRRRDVANVVDREELLGEVQMKMNSPRHTHLHRQKVERGLSRSGRRRKLGGQEVEQGQAGMDLRPCHICRRKPTVKKELDSFANCEGCGKRSCWVCIRECLGGWGNQRAMEGEDKGSEDKGEESWAEDGTQHRGMVCSRCCVERGTEGEVLCLGCLRMEETG
ncbi:hypothetical protein EYC84_005621 [Monilinia fructicola]|nr:hypothetical protein EYC84_005621 [Monilinia fructicola]